MDAGTGRGPAHTFKACGPAVLKLFSVFKFYYSDAGLSLSEGTQAERFNIFHFSEALVNSVSQGAGTPSVDNGDLGQMGQVSVIQVFFHFRDGLVHGFADQVNTCRNGGRLAHLNLSRAGFFKDWCLDHFFV